MEESIWHFKNSRFDNIEGKVRYERRMFLSVNDDAWNSAATVVLTACPTSSFAPLLISIWVISEEELPVALASCSAVQPSYKQVQWFQTFFFNRAEKEENEAKRAL